MTRISHSETGGQTSAAREPRVVPAPQHHVAHFYSSDAMLLSEVGQRFHATLAAGGAAMAIATPAHSEGMEEQLRLCGLDTAELAREGRWLSLDASEALEIFMVEGWPDEGLFAAFFGPVIDRLTAATSPQMRRGDIPVAGYGEMVAVLWEQGRQAAAIRLEQLWNSLGHSRRFHLFCGWPLRFFPRESDAVAVSQICAEHTHITPAPVGDGWRDENRRQRNLLWQLKAQATLQRASHIARQTLGFYREAPGPAWLSVQTAVDEVLALENHRLRERGISVATAIQPGLKIFCVPGDFKRIVANLISDAAEASHQDFSIALRAWNCRQRGGKAPGIRLTVAYRRLDPLSRFRARLTRPGRPAEDRSEPGLGMGTILEVVSKRGGSLRSRRQADDAHELRSGTVMMLFLPNEKTPADLPAPWTPESNPGAAA